MEHDDLVREFLAASGFNGALQHAIDTQLAGVPANLPQAHQLMLEYYQSKRDSLINDAGMVIATAFSDQQLTELTQFYKSELGVMLVSKMPQIASLLNVVIINFVAKLVETVEVELFEKHIDSM